MLSQKEVVEKLRSPTAYTHEVEEKIVVVETNISWVFLTGKFAYKMKKSIKFGDVLDFTTLKKRFESIKSEVVLNKRMAPDIYIGIEMVDFQGHVGTTSDPVEYLVKMIQLPQSSLLLNILKEKGAIDEEILQKIADEVSSLHQKNIVKPNFSIFDSIYEKWDENFRTTKTYSGYPFDARLEKRVYSFLEEHRKLFEIRKTEGKIVDGHGDLIVGNIFYYHNDVIIFDCIEFNEMLRIQDILEEVAFLSMDFDFHGKQEYSKQFIELYLKNMNEDLEENLKLLEFYKSYRAYVRAKVYYSLALQDKTEVQKKNHKELTSAYMKLASSYEF